MRRPRLLVLLTDSCASYFDYYYNPATYSNVEFRTPNSTLQSLLLKHKGVVNINGASKGQYAWTSQTKGALFTEALYELCTDQRKHPNKLVTWNSFFPAWQAKTNALFQSQKLKMLPLLEQYIAELKQKTEDVTLTPDERQKYTKKLEMAHNNRNALAAQSSQTPGAFQLDAKPDGIGDPGQVITRRPDFGVGRILLVNARPHPITIVVNGWSFGIGPKASRLIVRQPAGPFTYEIHDWIFGNNPPVVRTLAANETFTIQANSTAY